MKKKLKRIAIFGFFLLPLGALFGHEYRLSIGTIFKDEAKWMKEWIEYHLLIGVEHFFLYNNDSTDNYAEVLDPYIKKGIVELIPWGQANNAPWTDPGGDWHYVGYQLTSIDDCIKRALHRTQ